MIVLFMIAFGLVGGSFINALVWRLHAQQKAKSKKQKAKLSILRGRSMCPNCRHQLAVLDLIPVFSWLWLRGRCRYCHRPIDDNPLVEALLPAAFVLSYFYWPLSFDSHGSMLFGLWLIFLTGFMALAVYDLRWMLLPNRLVYPLLGLAVGQVLLVTLVFHGGRATLGTAGLGLLIDGGLFYALFQLSGGRWIGGGDVKLGALIGLLVGGPGNALLVLFLASLGGCLIALPLLLTGRATRTSRLPFGPFLLLAAVVTYLFGADLISWYRHLFLVA